MRIYGTSFTFATDSWHSVHFRVLSELQSSDDPVWMYFDSHHKHILDQITNVYQSSVSTIEGKPEEESFSHSANGKDSDQEKIKYQCDQHARGIGPYAPNAPPGCRCWIRRAKPRDCFRWGATWLGITWSWNFLQQGPLPSLSGALYTAWWRTSRTSCCHRSTLFGKSLKVLWEEN